MKTPIFVYEPNDLDVFESIEDAERYIEPIDVENNEFLFYDSEGQVLLAKVKTDSRGIERTVLTEHESREYDRPGLRRILIAFLGNLDYAESELEKKGLHELTHESIKFAIK